MMKNFSVIKVAGTSEELLETVQAESIKEVQKAMVKKYMNIVLSTQTQLDVRVS